MSNDTQPEIRFSGFTEDWEERKFGLLFEKNLEKNKNSEFDASRTISIATMHFKEEGNGAAESSLATYKVLRVGDIAYEGHTSKQFSFGRFVLNDIGDGIMSPRFTTLRPTSERPISFWKQYIHYEPIMRHLLVRSTKNGTMMNELVIPDLEKESLLVPSESEQKQIGAFFDKLDETITLHQRKLDLLKETKKGFLQKMFPKNGAKVPEIRFPGFTGDWEQRKLGEVSPLRGGFAFKSNKFVKEGIPIVRISNILSNGSVGGEFVYYTAQEKDENYLLPDKSALLAMSGATTGKVSILNNPNNNKVYQNQRVGYFTKTKNVDYSFISTLVRSKIFLDQLNSVLVAGAQPNISSKDINVFELTIPKNIEEQKKIGNFFKQLDDTIALQQRKLDLIKETKKGFLQKMFV
ncbi:restriction endonuclease subunit S [Enterococcus hirae]|uniref:restriction endonuclease subunit S n=1 Tax=Enterococcus hirae TaxID=1354 RepID=UPI00288EC003|nr:restriction endonuclease subunit S [Enterococcus hirae]MDT2622787.1 restriction endonuclease subunit S [Enterococcus hirae]